MDLIDFGAVPKGFQRERFFARSVGTEFSSELSDGNTEIDLYDEIGVWGVTAKDFRSKLKESKGDITLRINSPGGSVTEGIAIYNDLIAHKGNVRVEITGIAASIASVIAMAADDRAIAPNAFVMIHNAWGLTVGNKKDHAATISILEKMDDMIARTYATRTNIGVRSIKQAMDDESWYTGKEAVEQGFATELLTEVSGAKAKFDLSVFESAPDELAWRDSETTEKTLRDAERALRDAGWSRSNARKVLSAREDNQRDAGNELNLSGLSEALKAIS